MTMTRIYWCVGFGSSAETLSQQVRVKNIFQAIFNLAKKPPPPPEEEDVVSNQSMEVPLTTKNVEASIETKPLPPFIQEFCALSMASKLDHPCKKLPIIDVLYEDPPLPKEEFEVRTNVLLTIRPSIYS
jgi:hypothetical protein